MTKKSWSKVRHDWIIKYIRVFFVRPRNDLIFNASSCWQYGGLRRGCHLGYCEQLDSSQIKKTFFFRLNYLRNEVCCAEFSIYKRFWRKNFSFFYLENKILWKKLIRRTSVKLGKAIWNVIHFVKKFIWGLK